MKKTRTRIISFLLCLLMVMGSIYELPLAASVNESGTADKSVTENAETEPSVASDRVTADMSAEDEQPVTEKQAQEEETTNTSSVSENTPSEPETENTGDTDGEYIGDAVVENTDIPSDTDADTPDTVQVTFYDSDTTTVINSATVDYGCYLSDFIDSSSGINPVRRGYPLKMWYCVELNKTHTVRYLYNDYAYKKNSTFIAQWSTVPYKFDIQYNLNGGELKTEDEEASYPRTFTVETETFSLPSAQRKGYQFAGWYTDSSFTTAVTAIPKGTYIDSDQAGNVAPYTVYAKWTDAKPAQMQKPTAKNSATGKIKVTYTRLADADGYEITYSTDKKVKKDTLTKTLAKSKSSLTLSNLPQGGKYYFKVRAYKLDSTGEKCYGPYSAIASCKVTKGVKEYPAKSNSGKLKNVSIKNGTDLYVQAAVSQRLKSSDDFYYLVKVDPNTGKVLKQISKTDKTKNVVFQLPLKDDNGNNHIQGKFGVAVKKSNKYMLISSTSYINNPEAAASYTGAFPTPASKKGRQGRYDSSLGDKNYFNNFHLDSIIGTKSNHSVAYKYNGKTYYFYHPPYDDRITAANADGGTVTLQIMLRWNDNSKDLILKSGRTAPTQNPQYYAFNTEQKAAREKLEAAFCFLAEEFSKENYHVDNWIIGNEVNTYANPTAKWYYAGNISKDKFMNNYASTFRTLYYAVRSNSKNSRVYICCDHTWINRERDWGTKYFTEAFNKEIKSQNKNIKWNLAYHAYSAVLTNADFWNDGKLAPHSENADFVSPNNLEILTNYVKKNFGKDVRIILSEQGFSCSGGVGSPYNNGRQTGESVQAAAVAWLYYKAQFNDTIDAVIFSSGDHGGAGLQFDFIGRKAENVYKYMDTPKYNTYTKEYLKTIGASSWKSVVNGFSDKKLKKMPNR